jgi:hypothetical protein
MHSHSKADDDDNGYFSDSLDPKLVELLRRYEHKKLDVQAKTPLSVIHQRITKVFENQYIRTKKEMDYSKLGFRKGYLHISIKRTTSRQVSQRLSDIAGIIGILEVLGSYDILCACIYIDSANLFSLIEKIKEIEGVAKVDYTEEVNSFEIQEKNLFEGLWQNALTLPAPKPKKVDNDDEENVIPIETKLLSSAEDSFKYALYCAENADKGLLGCSVIGGLKLSYENKSYYQAYMNILSRYKKGEIKEGVRFVTNIGNEKEDIDLIKKLLGLGFEIKHIDYPIPMSFGVTDKQFTGTVEDMKNGRMYQSLMYSSEPMHLRHFQAIQQELWRKGIDAEERLKQIDIGYI